MKLWKAITACLGLGLESIGMTLFVISSAMQKQASPSNINFWALFPGLVLALIGFVLWSIVIFAKREDYEDGAVEEVTFVGLIFWAVALGILAVFAPRIFA